MRVIKVVLCVKRDGDLGPFCIIWACMFISLLKNTSFFDKIQKQSEFYFQRFSTWALRFQLIDIHSFNCKHNFHATSAFGQPGPFVRQCCCATLTAKSAFGRMRCSSCRLPGSVSDSLEAWGFRGWGGNSFKCNYIQYFSFSFTYLARTRVNMSRSPCNWLKHL